MDFFDNRLVVDYIGSGIRMEGHKADAEGKLTWYASLGATDARRIIDRFKELYPKIDAQFYRAGDAQLMERILAESRAGKVRLGCREHHRFLRFQS